jgi:cutinase
VPAGFQMPAGLTGPMPPAIADHVAAVALFGKPSSGFLQMIANTAPPITVGHLYSAKTMDLCIPEDPICSPAGGDSNAHNMYPADGLTDQAAEFVAQKVMSAPIASTSGTTPATPAVPATPAMPAVPAPSVDTAR